MFEAAMPLRWLISITLEKYQKTRSYLNVYDVCTYECSFQKYHVNTNIRILFMSSLICDSLYEWNTFGTMAHLPGSCTLRVRSDMTYANVNITLHSFRYTCNKHRLHSTMRGHADLIFSKYLRLNRTRSLSYEYWSRSVTKAAACFRNITNSTSDAHNLHILWLCIHW